MVTNTVDNNCACSQSLGATIPVQNGFGLSCLSWIAWSVLDEYGTLSFLLFRYKSTKDGQTFHHKGFISGLRSDGSEEEGGNCLPINACGCGEECVKMCERWLREVR